ncbi:MAG: UDP-N-acetylmuramoyl-L-alanine--D-glutamate ligase [Planctomycetota bacterium]
MITEYQDKQITVMGLGRFGGGVGVTRFLAERGADVLVTDTLPADELKDSVAQLADLEASGAVRYRLGEHNVSDFTTCDLVVVNPAVKPDNRFVRATRAADIPITSEIRLLVKHLPNRLRTIGVTGSAGKSTTTAMIAHILRKVLGQDGETPCGDWGELTPRRQGAKTPSRSLESPGVWMGGNIGGSLLPFVESIRDDDWVVLELSSFMLEGLREDEWSPHIAVITNISPNHLDWHGSMENYVAAKQTIIRFQQVPDPASGRGNPLNDLCVVPEQYRNLVFDWIIDSGPRLTLVAGTLSQDLAIPGDHNRINASLALAVASRAIRSEASGHATRLEIINSFSGLPHRLEYVGEFGQVIAYNDSKSTTPEAAKLAIEAFDAGQVRIILGGYDKGSDFSELATLAAERCAGVYTIGAMGDVIADRVEAAAGEAATSGRPETCGGVAWPEPGVTVERCGTLDVAVARAMRDAKASGGGEVLVLSPGCASWDQFANYEERGARFIELVKQHGAV